jgi:hypothetical protein
MRARNIKPAFFKNEDLADIGPYGQLLFAGLWCLADRQGKLEDRPRLIKAEIFPYYGPDPEVDKLLETLAQKELIIRYSLEGKNYIKIPNFLKHQRPHDNETESKIPEPLSTMEERTSDHGEKSCQPNEEALRSDSLNPDSLNPDSLNDDPLNPDSPPTPPAGGGEGEAMEFKGRNGKRTPTPLRMTPQQLVNLWNEVNPHHGTKKVTLTKERRRKAQSRLTEHDEPEWWRTVFQKIKDTPFLRGEIGTFKATLDWCIKTETNAMKVFEGSYDERTREKSKEKKGDYHQRGADYYEDYMG